MTGTVVRSSTALGHFGPSLACQFTSIGSGSKTRVNHAAGLPVPAAYELVEVECQWGIVFERVDGVSMLEYTQARP
jgi:hypothetical protein